MPKFSQSFDPRSTFSIFLGLSLIFSPSFLFAQDVHLDKYGGSVVFAINSDPKTFNEIVIKDASSSALAGYTFEGLTRVNPHTLKIEPNLAQKWTISPDGLTWMFYLREDVKWNDGRPFTADDVVFTYEDLIFNPDIPTSSRDIFTIEGKPLKVKKIDAHTVQFLLPAKFAPFLRGLGQPILPKHKLMQSVKDGTFNHMWGINTDPHEIVGTGPFQIVLYRPGERVVFEPNPYYWKKSGFGEKLPYIQKIIYLIVQNGDVGLLKFFEGTLDYIGLRGMDYPLLKPLEGEKNFVIYDLGPDMGSQFLFFNQNPEKNDKLGTPFVEPHKLKWFTNVNFRRAIAHTIDKEKIVEIVKNGLGYPQHSSMGPATGFFHNPNVRKYPYDLARAGEILDKEGLIDRDGDGYRDDAQGNRVEFSLYTNADNTERLDIAAIIRHDIEKIGIKVNFKSMEFNTLVSKLSSTLDWEAIILGLTGGVEPHFGKNVWHSSGQLHMWYPRQEKPATEWERRIDELFEKGVQELDEDKRKEIYDEFQLIVTQQLPVIYTVLSARLSAVRNKFGNLQPSNYGGIFHNIEEIYIKEEYR